MGYAITAMDRECIVGRAPEDDAAPIDRGRYDSRTLVKSGP